MTHANLCYKLECLIAIANLAEKNYTSTYEKLQQFQVCLR